MEVSGTAVAVPTMLIMATHLRVLHGYPNPYPYPLGMGMGLGALRRVRVWAGYGVGGYGFGPGAEVIPVSTVEFCCFEFRACILHFVSGV